MTAHAPCPSPARTAGFLARLARDRAGNALAIATAALFPLLAMVGGGIDIGRGYLSESRLQQACDAAVLAARKRLGTEAAITGEIPQDAAEAGERFFNVNFNDGAYGTADRTFLMTLEDDYSVSGRATVEVPTTLMAIFGEDAIPVSVECQAQLNMANTDVMMVLDVTGSMAQTNPGDTAPKIDELKDTVRNFYAQLVASAPPATRLRFGFVPYSSNVNVGALLKDEWVNTSWKYQTRELHNEIGPKDDPRLQWRYDQMQRDVSDWRTETAGCIEERATYEIDDYGSVDLARARDLDIDAVPTSDPKTRWSPMYPEFDFARSMAYDGTGSFTTGQKVTTDDFVSPNVIGLAACPAPARKLATITASQLDTYLATLAPTGPTYHDIGLIWGARLLSPSGLFAAENADSSSSMPSTRHLIFLTDGETAPRDMAYSAYGLEPLDRRRWHQGANLTLTQTVENRFSYVCDEVKKKNITVWVIGFGTAPNPVMEACSGADRYFVAADAGELQAAFATIARRMGELRVIR